MNKIFSILIISTAILTFTSASKAQIPHTLSYQGILTDTLGHPKPDGEYSFTFRIYSSEHNGSALWSETKTLTVNHGLFNTSLGDAVRIELEFDKPYWLGIQVSGDPELAPRIQLTSVGYSFNSLKSDTAGYALKAPQQNFTDSSRVAGTIPDNSVTTNKIADSAITSLKLSSGQVLKTLNGLTDDVTLNTTGGATISKSGNTITINAGSGGGNTGIQGLQNSNNTLDITNPNGPTTTINIKNKGIGTTQLADASITQSKFASDVTLPPSGNAGGDLTGTYPNPALKGNAVNTVNISDNAVTTSKIVDAAVTLAKLNSTGASSGQVPKFNGTNVSWADDNEGELALPYSGSGSGNPAAFLVTSTSGIALAGNGGYGVYGYSASSTGVYGDGYNNGVYGNGQNGTGVYGTGNRGVWGYSTKGFQSGVEGWGTNTGVYAHNLAGSDGHDVYISTPSYAAEMYGNVYVHGTVTQTSAPIKIDDPLDPANKYLYHSSVESSDMKNIYDGVVTLDTEGNATITLPAWFEALNKDFRYQLTAIGTPGPNLYISKEISGNSFSIAGGSAGMKVSWLVTGIRHDAWADAHRIPVEEDKEPEERGFYEHPELFGQPFSKMIQYAQHPELNQMQIEAQKVIDENKKMLDKNKTLLDTNK